MADEDVKKRVDDAVRRIGAASKSQSELVGQLDAKKAELAALCQEIKDAGYDPKNLRSDRDRVEAELKAMLDTTERELAEVEAALAAFKK